MSKSLVDPEWQWLFPSAAPRPKCPFCEAEMKLGLDGKPQLQDKDIQDAAEEIIRLVKQLEGEERRRRSWMVSASEREKMERQMDAYRSEVPS